MNIYEKLKWIIEDKIYKVKHYFEVKKCKKLYSDYDDNEYNIGSLKHIWGIKSWDDLSIGEDTNLYTMNDIDITYDRESKLYMLGIETAYIFKDRKSECKYLKRLLEAFTKYMIDNNYSINYDTCLFFRTPTINSSAESIEELYMNFKIFVEGYCSIYGYLQ